MAADSRQELTEAMARLKSVAEAPAFIQEEGPGCPKLLKASEGLKGKGVGRPIAQSRLDAALEVWSRFLDTGDHPSRNEMMTLCWAPDVVVSPEFRRRLKKSGPQSARSIKGLMASYHQKWDPSLFEIEKILKANLSRAKKSRGRVSAWSAVEDQLIGRAAPGKFATACITERRSAFSRLSELGLSIDSPFARRVAEKLIVSATAPRQDPALLNFATATLFFEDDSLLSPSTWGGAFDSAVSSLPGHASEEERQKIVDLALRTRRLPDPRINLSAWENVPERARRTIMQWLSKEDLRFFFDLIMEGQSDPQGRYSFWIRYAGAANRARVAIGLKDGRRLSTELSELRAKGRTYSRLRDAYGDAGKVSAFLMDFGKVTVVEFSKPGSACYVYQNDPREPYVDLTLEEFSWVKLKNRRAKGVSWHIHRQGWETQFERMLAQHGIRPE